MKKFLYLLQLCLKFLLIFILSFIWLRYCLKSMLLSSIIAASTSLLLIIVSEVLMRKKAKKDFIKISEKEDAENIFLSLLTDKNYMTFFENLSKSRHKNVQKKDNYILIKKNEELVLLYPFIKMKMLECEDIVNIAKINSLEKANKIIILCYDYDKTVLSFSKNFGIDIFILDRFDSYLKLYKEYDFYPAITIKYKTNAKLTFKELIAFSFNKDRTKGYLFASLILFISSFFIKLNIYYCIFSSILLIFAIISFINPKYNIKKIKELI